jgi:MoxR-like ATPase
MTVKLNEVSNEILVESDVIKQVTKVNTDSDIIINTKSKTYRHLSESDLLDLESYSTDVEWDRNLTRLYKKGIIEFLGDERLDKYKNTNLIYETLSKKFVNVSAVSEVFKQSLSTNMNLIIYGRGGFGKSEMCDELFGCTELKERVFVKSLSEATTEEDLFGGVNIKKMTDTGVIEYNVEESFANSEIVIFEEIFDANPRVLAALKDTLTAKEVRNGKQRFKIKTKLIIGLTNKSYDEIIEDDSIEALTQRFPISYKLQYDLHQDDIAALIFNRYPKMAKFKAAAIAELLKDSKTKTVLSPRKILEAAKYIKDINVRSKTLYSEKITNMDITPITNYLINKKSTCEIHNILIDRLTYIYSNVRDEEIRDYNKLIDYRQKINVIKRTVDDWGTVDEVLNEVINKAIEQIDKALA